MEKGELWWGYKHVNGTLHVKRFFVLQDIFDARRSYFVEDLKGPFHAQDREEALNNLHTLLNRRSL